MFIDQPDMPTGPNVLTPLSEYTVTTVTYVRYTNPITGEVTTIAVKHN